MRGVRVPGAEPGIKGVRGMISQKTYRCKSPTRCHLYTLRPLCYTAARSLDQNRTRQDWRVLPSNGLRSG
jgi:hypothetical protein